MLAADIGVSEAVARLVFETDAPVTVPIDARVIADEQAVADRYRAAGLVAHGAGREGAVRHVVQRGGGSVTGAGSMADRSGVEFIGFVGHFNSSETMARQGPAIDPGFIEASAKLQEYAGFDRVLVAFSATLGRKHPGVAAHRGGDAAARADGGAPARVHGAHAGGRGSSRRWTSSPAGGRRCTSSPAATMWRWHRTATT